MKKQKKIKARVTVLMKNSRLWVWAGNRRAPTELNLNPNRLCCISLGAAIWKKEMPPKKKSKSSSSSTSSAKKNHENSQQQQQQPPSKFGIQHFFNLHTQNALSLSQNPQPRPTPIPKTLSSNPNVAPPSNSHHLDADDNMMDVSPEITKSVSLQRFKFSPGMVLFIFSVFS